MQEVQREGRELYIHSIETKRSELRARPAV